MLRQLASDDRPVVLLTTYHAALQRLPPPTALAFLEVRAGGDLDRAALRAFCGSAGYRVDERVDEVGEVAFRGEVVDIFPGACALPYRLQFDDGRIETIRLFDPASQRSVGEAEGFVLGPVSELPDEESEDAVPAPGAEHRLHEHYPSLATLFDYMPAAVLVENARGEAARRAVLAQIAEAYAHSRRSEAAEGSIARAPAPSAFT